MKRGMVSAAPLATFGHGGIDAHGMVFGAITACAPAPSATRRHAPRLCGSVTPSSTSSKDCSTPAASGSQQLVQRGTSFATGSTRAATPWWPWLPASLAMRTLSASDQAGTGLFGAVQKLPHTRIAARGFVINFDDGFGGGLQAHAHGMKAEENFGEGHAGDYRCLAPALPGPDAAKGLAFHFAQRIAIKSGAACA